MWEPNSNKLLQWERSLCVLWEKGNLCIFIRRQMALRQLLELRNKSLKPKVEKFILQYCSFHIPPASQEYWFSYFSFLFFTFVFTMPRFPWFGGLACRIANCSTLSTETKVCLQVYWIIQRIYIFLSLILQLSLLTKVKFPFFVSSHNTKTTSWLDPRCLSKQQKPLEECEDDGKRLEIAK